MDVWTMEIGKGLARLFTQPFLYIAILMLYVLSKKRIRKERVQFGTRVFPAFSEWKNSWILSIIAGLVLTVVSLIGGIVVTYPLLLLIGGLFLLASLPMRLTWYSAAYILSFAYLIVFVLPYIPQSFTQQPWISELEGTPLTTIVVLLTAMLFVEAIMLLRTGAHQTFPERTKGRRGMWIGQHRARKLAIVPFMALMPADSGVFFPDWWPFLTIGDQSYAFILVPLLTGFEWIARAQAPEQAAKTIGRHVFVLGLLTLPLTVGSFFVPMLSLGSVILALAGREWIQIRHRIREDASPFFTPTLRGLRILGVMPGSPAEQMGLKPGELIERVNSISIRTETEFYEALQATGAFNKLEVIDEWGENRYVQRAMYEADHYELGLVFIEPPAHEESVGFF